MIMKINYMKTKFNVVLIGSLLVSGCATQIPEARTFPPVEQKKSMSVRHWGMIASDAVERTKLAMAANGLPQTTRLYVADSGRTEFDKGFRNYMITGLVNAGFKVTEKKEGAIEILYETQVVQHASFDPEGAGYKPGMATAGVAGFWILRDAFRTWPGSTLALGTTAAAAGYDSYRAINPGETGVELVLTTSIMQDGLYVMRGTDAYYIEHLDANLYQVCEGKFWKRNCKP